MNGTRSIRLLTCAAALLVLVPGCDDTLFGPTTKLTSYTADWSGVTAFMNDHCVSCHYNGGQGVVVLPDDIRTDLADGADYYVVPGKPDSSKLWRVVSGNITSSDYAVMPLGSGPLPTAETDHIRVWIQNGAVIDGLNTNADADGDGYTVAQGDCDDNNPNVHPGATEVCDHLDDDCNGVIDDGLEVAAWADVDGDGYGDPNKPIAACPGEGSQNATDCDDTNAAIHPGAAEVCDGADDNCDGAVDSPLPASAPTWYLDADGDGYGGTTTSVQTCAAPAHYVADNTDCNDSLATVNPGATEVCNGRDDNCNGLIDEGPPADAPTWYYDGDKDGYGDDSITTVACAQPSGYVALGGDCNDTDPAIHPGAPETNCTDPVDYNCDGETGYTDSDGDGYPACQDCDDTNASIHPGATEVCDGHDDNCDGSIDNNAVDALTFYVDADGDGFGGPTTVVSCTQPTGTTTTSTDCDDTNASIFPGAAEYCDGADDDCDGTPDDNPVDGSTWYRDADGDGYGDPNVSVQACSQPDGYVADNTDCDDTNASVNPGVTYDGLNGIDDDCDGLIDEDATPTVSYANDIQPIWEANCVTGCHSGPHPTGGLNLHTNSWANLVNVPSIEASMDRVTPFHPETSYLWAKLNGTQVSAGGSGDQMPKGKPPLGSADLTLVHTWINEGAQQ